MTLDVYHEPKYMDLERYVLSCAHVIHGKCMCVTVTNVATSTLYTEENTADTLKTSQ